MHVFRYLAVFLVLTAAALYLPGTAAAGSITADTATAVIVGYNRIGEDQYPETNIRTEQFKAHLEELTSGDYNIMSLPAVLNAFAVGQSLPDKTVVLTFDGGHKSFMDNALPLLEQYDLPFTVFISPNYMNQSAPSYMDWKDIKRIARNAKATIGLHPYDYKRIADLDAGAMNAEINNAIVKYREMLKAEPAVFSYPFGEYSRAYKDLISHSGFRAALTQNSGAAHAGSDLFALPRFVMTDSYGDIGRFRLILAAKPLPVSNITPDDPYLHDGETPEIGFTIDKDLAAETSKLSCFASDQGKLALAVNDGDNVRIKTPPPFTGKRMRINCTMPVGSGNNTWRWFGMLLVSAPDQDAADGNADQDDLSGDDNSAEEESNEDLPVNGDVTPPALP